jgi:hypothetical protein
METKNFEEKLIQMTKPEVSKLKHQDLLSRAIANARDKSVFSWWWLSVPLYVVATLLMKTMFIRNTTLISNIHEFAAKQKSLAILFFIIVPIVFITLNFISIRKIYILSNRNKIISLLEEAWFNFLMIAISVFILIVYSL